MHIGAFEEWSSDNIWVLVLLAMGFRLEAIFCRSVKEYHRTKGDHSSMLKTARRQESAMFELSTIIQRASMHQVLHICPLSLYVIHFHLSILPLDSQAELRRLTLECLV